MGGGGLYLCSACHIALKTLNRKCLDDFLVLFFFKKRVLTSLHFDVYLSEFQERLVLKPFWYFCSIHTWFVMSFVLTFFTNRSLDSPTAELIRIWTNENRLVTFPDLMEVLR